MNQNICVPAPVCMLNSTIRSGPIADLSTLSVLPGDSRFCLLSPGLQVFYNFLPVFPCFSAEISCYKNDRNDFLFDKVFC